MYGRCCVPVHFLHDEFQWCAVTSAAFFALLFRSLFALLFRSFLRTVIPQPFRTVIPQFSSHCYSVVFFALLFRSLLLLVIPSSSAEFAVVAVLTVSFVQGRSEGDVRVENFFKERTQVCLHFRCDASEVAERFFRDVEVGIIVFCCSAVDEEECRHERSCDIFFSVFASEEHVGVEAGL